MQGGRCWPDDVARAENRRLQSTVMAETLDHIIRDAPLSILPAVSKERVRPLAKQLDAVAYAEGARCYLDGRALRRALGTAISPAAVERVLAFAKQNPNVPVIDRPSQHVPGTRVPFLEFVRLTGATAEPAGSLGLATASTLEEVKRALLQRLPGLSADVFDSDLMAGLRAHFEATPATAAPAEPAMGYGSWELCMLNNGVVGATLFFFGVALLAELASGGAVTPALVYLFIICFGGGALTILAALNICR